MNNADRQKRNLRRKEARPDEIIASAIALWSSQGFATTKIEEIAKGAGVAKGTVYLYFPSKEALFEAAVKNRMIGAMERFGSMREDYSLSTWDLLRSFYTTVYHELFVNGSATLLKVLLTEGHRFPELTAFYKTTAMPKGLDAIAGILRRGVERGELSDQANTIDKRLLMAPIAMFVAGDRIFGESTEAEFFRVIEDHLLVLKSGLSVSTVSLPEPK